MNRREIAPFGFRMRPEVKEAAKEEAERNRRSLNTELELLVEESLERRKQQGRA